MWTATADSILDKIERLCNAVVGTSHWATLAGVWPADERRCLARLVTSDEPMAFSGPIAGCFAWAQGWGMATGEGHEV